MIEVIRAFYAFPDKFRTEIVLYLETCIEILKKTKETKDIDVEMIIDILSIRKINEELHQDAQVKFLCKLIEDHMVNISVERGKIFTAIRNEDMPKVVDTDEPLFNETY